MALDFNHPLIVPSIVVGIGSIVVYFLVFNKKAGLFSLAWFCFSVG